MESTLDSKELGAGSSKLTLGDTLALTACGVSNFVFGLRAVCLVVLVVEDTGAVVAVVDVGVALVGPGETFLAPKLARFEIPSILSNTSSSGRTVPRGVNSDGAAYLALTGATCFEVA